MRELWTHQQEAVELILSRDKTLLLAGVGVGKTLATIVVAERAKHRRVLVLTMKKPMRSVWEAEFKEAMSDGLASGWEILVLDKGSSVSKAKQISKAWETKAKLAVIVNYETAKLLSLDRWNWDFAIADESHKLKSHDSQTSIKLAASLRSVPHKVAMTGTAWDDRPTDVYGQIRWLDPLPLGRQRWGAIPFGSWNEFFEQYVVYWNMNHIKIPKSYKNQDQLADKIWPYIHIIDREKVLTLPPVLDVPREVSLKKGHMDFYETLRDEMIAKIDGNTLTASNALALGLRLQQVAGGFYKPDGAEKTVKIPDGDAKKELLLDLVDELGQEPFVVFTRFTDEVYDIGASLKRLNIDWVQTADNKDQHMLWQQGVGQALIVNISSGGAGINLTRAAYGFFYSTGYSNTEFVQAQGRIDRPKQTRKVTFYHIAAAGTVDGEIQRALRNKASVAQSLLDSFGT